MEVEVQSVSTVRPLNSTPPGNETHFLACCDQVCRSYPYVNRIFFYRLPDHGHLQHLEAHIERLRDGLSKTLVHFYPLAGRLGYDPNSGNWAERGGRLVVNCNDAGAKFAVALARGIRLSDLSDEGFQYRPGLFWRLCLLSDLIRSDLLHEPLLAVQVTKFEDGGVAIGVSISHVLVDAQSCYDFVRCWAEMSRGAEISMPPKHMRQALSIKALFAEDRVDENGHREGAKEELNRAVDVAILQKASEQEDLRPMRTDLVQRVFSFSAEALLQLKKKANENRKGTPYTTFEAFVAHWWKALIKAKAPPRDQVLCLLIPVNCRQRFLGLDKAYFGNCLDGAAVESTANELCNGELGDIAFKISGAIKDVTEERFLNYVRQAEGKNKYIAHFDRSFLFHVADSPRFAIYDIDFGWGTPLAVRAEGFRFGAEVQMIRGKDGPGSIDLFCALEPAAMEALLADEAFLTR